MDSRSLTPTENAIDDLIEVMRRLRDPVTGCPWDLEQDFRSIAPYTIEEAYEVADAIERNDLLDLKGELGDLLLQVVFHSQMASEDGTFTIDDVARSIVNKMVARHPHVFGDADIKTAEAQTRAWEVVKEAERRNKAAQESAVSNTVSHSALDGVAEALPALMRAEKLLKRAARTGFDWPSPAAIVDKLQEELAEVDQAAAENDVDALEDEIGDVLIVATNLARKHGVDPETALRRATRKFEQRFRQMESLARDDGRQFSDLDLGEQETLWQRVKQAEKR